ncbi:N-acetylglucosamine-binding protein GbpA [Pseudomonas sp. NPDC089996]|uniref:N-acetylglucosamine-binding protein GbpA n=1 Tax=Pseudomonas sp. NPDC089996 TaxID=3364474 RepID=UPI00382E0D75
MITAMTLRKSAVAAGVWMAVAGAGLQAQIANAHGYLADPPSRAGLCHATLKNLNTNCGQAEWEPWSVGEAVGRFPGAGPVDGKIASGGVRADFVALDEQSANRWHLTPITDRNLQFDWHYEAPHLATSWEYFITKADWNPNTALTRASFDDTPFCAVDGNNQMPAKGTGTNPKHSCTLPADRSGQHVILGVWKVGDTDKAFHSVADVDIQLDGGPNPEWPRLAEISASRDLEVGDKVTARAFDANGERTSYHVQITVDSDEEGFAANWAYKLAKQINETQTLVRAGKMDADGNIEPVQGSNSIFAKSESGLTNYILDFDAAGGEPTTMHLHDVKPEYTIVDGKGVVDFAVMTNKALTVTARLFDGNNKQVAYSRQNVNGTGPFALNVESVQGEHTLKVVGVDKRERVLLQDEKTVQLKPAGDASYDFVFPESLSNYKAGTKVLQPKNGKVYECQPFPNSGYCVQYSADAAQFEPGTGSNWNMAWTEK